MDNSFLYNYKAFVTKVYDGDTCTVDIDLGCKIWIKKTSIRVVGIDAPELRTTTYVEGKKSRDFLRSLILDKEIILQTEKDKTGKYGRIIGKIWVADESGEMINVSDKMVSEGFAVYKEY